VAQFKDMLGVWIYHAAMEEAGLPHEEALQYAAHNTRDKCRTPMQWANAPNGGFSPEGAQTWLPVNPNYAQGINVAEQKRDPGSLLNFYKQMLRLRKETPALIAGDTVPLLESSRSVLAFLRRSQADRQTCLVALNLSDRARAVNFDFKSRTARRLYSSSRPGAGRDKLSPLELQPFEIYIGELAKV
jgi:alpha-glucosidase